MPTSKYEELDINSVQLDVDNPRIKMYLENYEHPSAEGIALALNTSAGDGQTSFSSLKESIRVNGGIINPIIVNHKSDGTYVVIEGNTRLQIYKDFSSQKVEGDWSKIRCIVYENLSEAEIHSIRLQSHLVGPRDWDPYSKAKYLNSLMYEEMLPIATIISFCGGKKTEINKLVAAYRDMQQYYVPKIKEAEMDVDYKDFSKFSELQNKSITEALVINGYNKEDFASWVINGNIDTAQNVRLLPAILKSPKARKKFLEKNIKDAMSFLSTPSSSLDLKSVDYIDLCKALNLKLDNISLKEARSLSQSEGQEKKAALLALRANIDFLFNGAADLEDGEE